MSEATDAYRSVLAALGKHRWPIFPEKIEMSPATLHAVKTMAQDAQTAADLMRFTSPMSGVPVFIDATIPDGQGRVTWQDGRVEYIGSAA